MRYQKKTQTAGLIADYFREIKKAIQDMQNEIDAELDRTLTQLERDKNRLLPEAFEDERKELSRVLTNTMASCHAVCEAQVRPYFIFIRDTVSEWAMTRPSPDLIEMIKVFHDFDLVPTVSEMSLLFDNATGCYLSMKLLNTMAEKAGIMIEDTPSLDQIMRSIDEAEAEVISSTYAFAGNVKNGKIPGIDYLETSYPFWSIFNSAVYLTGERETRLSELEKMLMENTTPIDASIELSPSKRREMDALFEDQDEAARANIARNLIENDYGADGILKRYDARLYNQVLSAIATEADAQLEEIERRKKLLAEAETAEKQRAVSARTALTRSTASAS